MLFSLFVRNADMPAGLSFLQIFYGKFNPQSSNLKDQSVFMRKLSCEFIYVARFLRFFFKNKSSGRLFQKYFSIFANKNISYQLFNYEFWS
jgi:hypothetical protein